MKTHRPSYPLWLAATVAIGGLFVTPSHNWAQGVLVESPKLEKPEDEEGCCGKYDFGPDYVPSSQAHFTPLMEPVHTPAHPPAPTSPAAPAPASTGPRPALGPAVPPTFTNATAFTITDCPSPCGASGQAASLYPSPITVSGVSGVVQRVSVKLNGFSHAFPSDVDMLLVSPSGRKVILMSDFGGGSPGVSNIALTLDDYAATPIPSTVNGNTGRPFISGSYRPANSGTSDTFPAPAPAEPYNYSLSAFNGDGPNGTWSLFIIDDANLDGGSVSGGWSLTFDVRPPAPATGDILISEFRTRGTGTNAPSSDGSADEFIELYNNTDQSITIIDSVPGADPTLVGCGWRFGGAQGGAETFFNLLPQLAATSGPLAIPARGHFLITIQPSSPSPPGNTYSLANYPTGSSITNSGTPNLIINPPSAAGLLPDNVGIALFSTATAIATTTPAKRLDSVGFSSVTNATYKEGAGLAPANGITTASQHAWVRKRVVGVVQDTGNNAADFQLVETTGALLNGVAATLGAPGPERTASDTAFTTSSAPSFSAIVNNMTVDKLDPSASVSAAPNAVVDYTAVPNGALGTLKLRAKITNFTGQSLLALRYRAVLLPTRKGGAAPAAAQADLRLLSNASQSISITGGGTATTQALTLQTATAAPQDLGGGLNSSLGEGIISTGTPLATANSTNVEFTFGIEKFGDFDIGFIAEGLTVTLQPVSGQYFAAGRVTANPAEFTTKIATSNPDTAYTTAKTSILIDVLANDVIFPGRLITIASLPAFGTVTVVGGKIRYTPTTTLPVGGDSFSYRYNGIVTTVIVPNLSNITGAFAGAVLDTFAITATTTHERSGRVQLTVGATGAYTGSFSFGGVLRGALSGSFLGNSGAIKTTVLRTPELPLVLNLTPDPVGHTFTGSVESTDFNGDSFFSSAYITRRAAIPAFANQAYVLQVGLTGVPRAPAGNGYATMKISPLGDVTVAGRLADGAPLTQTAMMMADQSIPLYFSPYPKATARGSFRGGLMVPAPPSTGIGFFNWFKWPRPGEALFPNGIITSTVISAVPYTPPPLGTRLLAFNNVANNGRLIFLAGGIVTFNQVFTLGTNNKAVMTLPNPNKVTLTFVPATGVFTGTFVNPVSKKVTPFAGGVFQVAFNCSGYFIGATPYDAGQVLVEKMP